MSTPHPTSQVPDAGIGSRFVEPRWPIGLALTVFIAINITLRLLVPARGSFVPPELIPAVEALLLVTLVVAEPAMIRRHHVWLRRLSIVLLLTLAAASLVATIALVVDLIRGGPTTNSATSLLATGALIWIGNNLVFALLYWEFDSGGAYARFRRAHPHPDFAFPQQLNPNIAPKDWRPKFVDYLYLGLTNGTAFSPTDVMPLAPWAKLTMALQSVISLVVIGLVIARAVNVLT